MFIIYDRLFNTFIDEVETPTYGLVHPVQTFEPTSVQFEHLKTIFQQIITYPTLSMKLKGKIKIK